MFSFILIKSITLSYLLSIQYVYERVFLFFALKILASLAGCKHKTFFRFSQMFFFIFFLSKSRRDKSSSLPKKFICQSQNSKNLFAVAGAKVGRTSGYTSAFWSYFLTISQQTDNTAVTNYILLNFVNHLTRLLEFWVNSLFYPPYP